MRRIGNGFTLVELLVVIAIISVLAAMLLPSLDGAMRQAKTVSCVNTYKQIGVSLVSYAGDFNNWYPYRPSTWGATTNFGAPGDYKLYAYDDRPMLSLCMDLDNLPFCALAPVKPAARTDLKNLVSKADSDLIQTPCDIFAGAATNTGFLNKTRSMLRVGERHRWNDGFSSNVVAGDTYRPCGNYTSSGHPDADGMFSKQSYYSNVWRCVYMNYPNASHGVISRTFVFDDGHAVCYENIVPMPASNSTRVSTDPRMQVELFGTQGVTFLPKKQ